MARTASPDIVSMAKDLTTPFYGDSEAVLSWHNVAMARGETEGGIQIPRFVIAKKMSGIFGTDLMLEVTPIEDGETDEPERRDGITVDVYASETELVLNHRYENSMTTEDKADAQTKAEELIPAAFAAEPLAIDRKVAQLLLPAITK